MINNCLNKSETLNNDKLLSFKCKKIKKLREIIKIYNTIFLNEELCLIIEYILKYIYFYCFEYFLRLTSNILIEFFFHILVTFSFFKNQPNFKTFARLYSYIEGIVCAGLHLP